MRTCERSAYNITMAKRAQRRERRKLHAYRFFNKILRSTLGAFLRLRYNVHSENFALLKQLKAPYLLLPNHMSFWDPFFLGTMVREPVYYVASDAHFRSPLLNFLLGLVGAIPKTKVMNDYETVHSILRVRKANGVVGIFPEGRRTWDGTTLPMYFSIAKLARLLKVPVVTVIFQGAFLSLPRWTKKRRAGTISVKFQLTCTAEEAARLSPDQIFVRISEDLDYNEYEYQRNARIRFKGKRRAEKIEQVLYACPHCRQFGSLFSRDEKLRCVRCGYTVTYDEMGLLHPVSPFPEYHSTVRAWNVWQSGLLLEHLIRFADPGVAVLNDHEHEPIFRKGHIALYTGYRSQPLKRHPPGVLELHTDGILRFRPGNTEVHSTPQDPGCKHTEQREARVLCGQGPLLLRVDHPPMVFLLMGQRNHHTEGNSKRGARIHPNNR